MRSALHHESSSSTKTQKSDSDEIPQLETSTDSSYCGADDDGSVSSLSTSASQRGVRPRSLFMTYWERNGGRASAPSLPTLPDEVIASFESNHPDERLFANISYEEIIQETTTTTATRRTTDIPARPRREIFGIVGPSTSAPALFALSEPAEFRKTKSTSALTKKGCLRSSFRKQDRRPSDASVTFSPKVDVRIFETPTLQWAAKGWSKLFTSGAIHVVKIARY